MFVGTGPSRRRPAQHAFCRRQKKNTFSIPDSFTALSTMFRTSSSYLWRSSCSKSASVVSSDISNFTWGEK